MKTFKTSVSLCDVTDELIEEYRTILINEDYDRSIETYVDAITSTMFSEEDLQSPYCSDSSILEQSIYDLRSEKEIADQERIDLQLLQEGSANLKNFEELEKQALDYFKKPNSYPVPNETKEKLVKVFIQLFTGIDKDGNALYKSVPDSFEVTLQESFNVELLKENLRAAGYELSELVQLKLYSIHLSEYFGSKDYKDGEFKSFEKHSIEWPNILYAIPCSIAVEKFSPDDSIYHAIDQQLKGEVLFGRIGEEVVGKQAFSHWSICKEFYQLRVPQMIEDEEYSKWESRVHKRVSNREHFKSKFEKEVKTINQLNNGKLSIIDLMEDSTAHFVNRILYVARSRDFKERINSRSMFIQLIALSKKLKHKEGSVNKAA